MVEKLVQHRSRQTIMESDLNNAQLYARASIDHVVGDGIEEGRRFIGFDVTQKGSLQVLVSAGRLYFDGGVYPRDEVDGITVDLNSKRPNLQKKIIAIVVWPDNKDEAEQRRDFEIDADTFKYVPQDVAMENWRYARIEALAGSEDASPQPPQIAENVVAVAFVQMGPAGIESIVRNTEKLLPNLSRVADRVDDLDAFAAENGPQVKTLKTDLARLSKDLEQGGDGELLMQMAGDIALLKERADLPDTYVDYRALPFTDTSKSKLAALGYAARIVEGLRFPFADSRSAPLALYNPNQPDAKLSAGGLLLPAYRELERRITKGHNGDISLAEYSVQEGRTLTKLSMSRARTRFAQDFEVVVGGPYWNSGTYVDRLNTGTRNVFQKNGENFQVYETGKVDQDGHRIVRLAKFWTDEIAAPYWSRLTTEHNLLGYAHIETHLNGQDRWVVGLGPHITAKPANGQLTVGICKTYRGEPDFEQVIAMTTVNAADVQLVNVDGAFPKIPIEPTFLKGGESYGYFIVTQHPFRMGVCDAQTAALQGTTGSYFYGMNGGVWHASPEYHLIWRDYSAVFPKARVDIDLQPVELPGGIQGIDILTDAIRPGSTDVVYSIFVNGAWRPIDQYTPDVLATLPPLLQLRATFVGTPDVMPGIRLEGSVATVSRLALSAKHVAITKAIGSSMKIVVTARMRGFDAAHHSVTFKIDRGPGNMELADLVTTKTLPDGTIEKVATFNLAAAATAYESWIEMTTDAATRPFVVAHAIEVAQP